MNQASDRCMHIDTYDEFLDKYIELVPPSFGFTKEELANIPELAKFLGY